MALDDELQKILQVTRGQARDQAVSAIKELRMPNRKLKWLLFVGPYFAEVELGPFSDAELQTRKHKPNPSGDVVELIIAKLEKQARHCGSCNETRRLYYGNEELGRLIVNQNYNTQATTFRTIPHNEHKCRRQPTQ